MVTAELAVAIPAIVFVLALCLAGITAAIDQIRCIDAARVAARAAARGDDLSHVMGLASLSAPAGASVMISGAGPGGAGSGGGSGGDLVGDDIAGGAMAGGGSGGDMVGGTAGGSRVVRVTVTASTPGWARLLPGWVVSATAVSPVELVGS